MFIFYNPCVITFHTVLCDAFRPYFFSHTLVLSAMKPSPQQTSFSGCWKQNKSCHSLISTLHTVSASLSLPPLNPVMPLAGLSTAKEKRGQKGQKERQEKQNKIFNLFGFRLSWKRSIFLLLSSLYVLVDRNLIMIPLSPSTVIYNIILQQAKTQKQSASLWKKIKEHLAQKHLSVSVYIWLNISSIFVS